MKKLFLPVVVCLMATAIISCGKKTEKAETTTNASTQTERPNQSTESGTNDNTTSNFCSETNCESTNNCTTNCNETSVATNSCTATDSCATVSTADSCASNVEYPIAAKSIVASTSNETEKIDTLSYIFGMDMSNRIENEIIPVFQIDYNTMMSALEQALDPNAIISVEGEQFNKENYREIGDKYISNSDLRTRIMIAMSDSTAQIYNDEKEKLIVSAILGADFAYSASNAGLELDHNSFKNAIYDYHNGNAIFTDEFAMEYTRNYFTVVIPQQNKQKSEAWLAEIEKQEGVKKTASGILYKIVSAGNDSIKARKDEDVVKVLYTGRTRDGKVFDSNRWNDMPSERQEMIKSYQPDQAEKDNAIEFPLNRVIKGWTEGMKLVGKGGRIILWIPSELAYGERGTGQDIGPNEALCFDVELLDVTNE